MSTGSRETPRQIVESDGIAQKNFKSFQFGKIKIAWRKKKHFFPHHEGQRSSLWVLNCCVCGIIEIVMGQSLCGLRRRKIAKLDTGKFRSEWAEKNDTFCPFAFGKYPFYGVKKTMPLQGNSSTFSPWFFIFGGNGERRKSFLQFAGSRSLISGTFRLQVFFDRQQ